MVSISHNNKTEEKPNHLYAFKGLYTPGLHQIKTPAAHRPENKQPEWPSPSPMILRGWCKLWQGTSSDRQRSGICKLHDYRHCSHLREENWSIRKKIQELFMWLAAHHYTSTQTPWQVALLMYVQALERWAFDCVYMLQRLTRRHSLTDELVYTLGGNEACLATLTITRETLRAETL